MPLAIDAVNGSLDQIWLILEIGIWLIFSLLTIGTIATIYSILFNGPTWMNFPFKHEDNYKFYLIPQLKAKMDAYGQPPLSPKS